MLASIIAYAWFQENNVDKSVRDNIVDYYEYLWTRTQGYDLHDLFEGVPESLWGEVTLELYGDVLRSMELFKTADWSFIQMLSKCVRPQYLRAGDCIFRRNDPGDEVYFISEGANIRQSIKSERCLF